MDILNCKEPEWYTEPEKLDFKLINQPLEQIYSNMEAKLKNENKEQSNFYFILKSLLTTSFRNYKAMRKLVTIDPKYPLEAHILGRCSIDSLFVIVSMVENPKENAIKYQKADYRIQWEIFQREKQKYGNDQKWSGWLKDKESFLDWLAKSLVLSNDEKNNPIRAIQHWPNPYQLLANTKKPVIPLSNDKRQFLEHIRDWRYGELSGWSHMSWAGLAMGVFATMPENHWSPGKYESDAVYTGILFLLMIVSEIEIFCRYGEVQNLRYAWTILNSFADEAKEYYDLRYDKLLT